MFVTLHILFATFWLSFCTHLQNQRIVDVPEHYLVDDIYVKYMIQERNRNKDIVCSLSTNKKITLCQEIFRIIYSNSDSASIYLNKIAFFLSSLTCIKKQISIKTRSDYIGKLNTENVYPCYGRHNPVRTSFIEDDYYDKFYVSDGPFDSSVMIYIHEHDVQHDWFTVYSYLEINIHHLGDTSIELSEIVAELKLNRTIAETFDQKVLEYIYTTEHNRNNVSDSICDQPTEILISLCELILDRPIYKDFFSIEQNKSGTFLFSMESKVEQVNIAYAGTEKSIITQKMCPCFSKSYLNPRNLSFAYSRKFQISAGPRKNSIFVYYRESVVDKFSVYYLYELLENVPIRSLKPKQVTYLDVMKESTVAKIIIDQMIGIIMKTDTIPPPGTSKFFVEMLQACKDIQMQRKKNLTVQMCIQAYENLLLRKNLTNTVVEEKTSNELGSIQEQLFDEKIIKKDELSVKNSKKSRRKKK